jgi:PAS domain S-box-containing protein
MTWASVRPNGGRTVAELSLSAADLHLVVDSLPHVVWVAGPDGNTEYLNRWARDYLGSSVAEQGVDWVPFVHPDDIERCGKAWLIAIGDEVPCNLDYRLRRADGEFRWHRIRVLPQRGTDGTLLKWVGTATDIHDQTCLEESLRRSQQATAETLGLLETLLSAAPVGIGFVDLDYRFVRLNDTLAGTLGHPAGETVGRGVAELVPALWPELEPVCRSVRDTGATVRDLEITAVAAEPDRARSLLANFYPVRAADRIIGIGIAAIDITRRTEAEEFRSVVMDNMAEGLYTIDEDGRLTSMNRAAARLLGRDAADLLGTDMQAAVQLRRTDPVPGGHLHPLDDDGAAAQSATGTMVRGDGTAFPISYSAAPLRAGGTVSGGTVVVFRDITALKERQRQEITTRHDQKLESLGRLSAGIAHEVNTPIQFVGDNTRFLAGACREMLDLLLVYRECLSSTAGYLPWEERLKKATDAEQAADVDYLAEEIPLAVAQSLEGIERVASLVRAMKSFSYKDSDTASYANLNEALETTLTVARNEVKYVADVALDLGELPDVLCHLGDLNQVFLNLLVNAADALQGRAERGEIRITTRAEGQTVVIGIADNGTGIPPELHQVIFEPFFTTKEVGRGTGQGLALAQAVVGDKHGGSIEVNSAPGEGTQFLIRLPVDGKRHPVERP